jgi:hypothetical protein
MLRVIVSERLGGVFEQSMPASLRFQHQGECRIALYADGLERIHLDRDGEAHEGSEQG